AVSRQWDVKKHVYHLAFGEKHLLRFYPENFKSVLYQVRDQWDDLWNRKDKSGFWLYLIVVSLWSLPVICFLTHPYWSIAGFFLLVLYRFFTKIVFQESWLTIFLHPLACVVWMGSFFWWISGSLKSKYGSQASISP